jgi:glycosyltransferase involved in cell wall biosynthesis
MPNFTLNCSRVGVTGGLLSFAEQVMICLNDPSDPLEVVLPDSVPGPPGIKRIPVPAYLASDSIGSMMKPLSWLLYSRFRFPVPKNRRILCTSHHVLPGRKNQIVSVLDIRPYYYPDSKVQSFYFRHMLPRALKQCDGVLTISEASRNMLMEIYGLPESFIRVVPITIKMQALTPAQIAGSRQVNAPEYLLMVGASYVHKNAEEVLRMHHLWAPRYRLKILAAAGAYRDGLIAQVTALGIADRVDFLSRIDDLELKQLYANCAALVYPSKVEGFGLPPLEAMSCGRPVIVSDIPVFRELYSTLPQFVALGSEESWAKALEAIDNPIPKYIERATALANSFSEERMRNDLNAALRHFWG